MRFEKLIYVVAGYVLIDCVFRFVYGNFFSGGNFIVFLRIVAFVISFLSIFDIIIKKLK